MRHARLIAIGLGGLGVGMIVVGLIAIFFGIGKATAKVTNASGALVNMHIKFGTGTKAHPFCDEAECVVPIPKGAAVNIPTCGEYLNATLSFNAPVGCGATKVELNLNNPAWYDIVDVSLVDGWNIPVEVIADGKKIGPVTSAVGNENAFGVYPLGCDVCVARENPPCGYSPGKTGCKSGTQYKPDVPCQYQGTVKGGGTSVLVTVR